MILRENLPIRKFRLIYFPLHFVIEITLLVLCLVLPFYDVKVGALKLGATSLFGIILASISFLIAGAMGYLFLTGINFKNEKASFLSNTNINQIISFSVVFLLLARIGVIALSFLYQIPFSADKTAAVLMLIFVSTLTPFMFYFISNFEDSPSRIYSLNKEAPTTLKLATIWMVFLVGAMQIFSTEIAILIVSLVLLFTSYFFFRLDRWAISLSAIILFIHAAFSFLFAGVVFANLNDQVTAFREQGFDFTQTDAILVNVFFFLIPGIISIIIGGNFYRKSVTGWVKSLYASDDEMDILSYYETDDEDSFDIDE